MAIRVKCSQCGKALQTSDAASGKRVRCPGCGTILLVPVATSGDEPTPAPKPLASKPAPTREQVSKKPKRTGLIIGGTVALVIACALAGWLIIGRQSGGAEHRTEAQLVETYMKYVEAKDIDGIMSLTCHDGMPAEIIADGKEFIPDLLKQKIKSVKTDPIPAAEKAEMMRGNVVEGKLYVPNVEPFSFMVVEYETDGNASGHMKRSKAPIGRKGDTYYFVGTKVGDAPSAQSFSDPAMREMCGKTLVLVAETGGAISDIQVLDALPEEDIIFNNDKGVVVTVFGIALEDYDAAHPAAMRVSDENKVTVFSDNGKVVVFGQTHSYGVPMDNAFQKRVREFLDKPKTERPAPVAVAPSEEDTFFDGAGSPSSNAMNQAIKTLLVNTGESKLLREATGVQSSSDGQFAKAFVSTQDGAKHAFYIFKEGDGWVAYAKLPTHKDSIYVFVELGGEYLTAKRGQKTNASFCDDSWKNKNMKQRTINVVYDDGGKQSTPMPVRFDYNEKEGWHIVDSDGAQLVTH